MKHTKFAIDLQASDKGERKKAVEYLRSKGYEVIKRKDEYSYVTFNYLNFYRNRDRFEYGALLAFNQELLTLPRDWKKFVDYVEPEQVVTEKKREPKIGDWVVVEAAVHDSDLIGKTLPITKVSENRVYVEHGCASWSWGLPGLRFATPEEIAVAENPAPKLETGMLVELASNQILIVTNDTIINKDTWDSLDSYNLDLTIKEGSVPQCDIIRVSRVLTNHWLRPKHWTKETLRNNLLWERK